MNKLIYIVCILLFPVLLVTAVDKTLLIKFNNYNADSMKTLIAFVSFEKELIKTGLYDPISQDSLNLQLDAIGHKPGTNLKMEKILKIADLIEASVIITGNLTFENERYMIHVRGINSETREILFVKRVFDVKEHQIDEATKMIVEMITNKDSRDIISFNNSESKKEFASVTKNTAHYLEISQKAMKLRTSASFLLVTGLAISVGSIGFFEYGYNMALYEQPESWSMAMYITGAGILSLGLILDLVSIINFSAAYRLSKKIGMRGAWGSNQKFRLVFYSLLVTSAVASVHFFLYYINTIWMPSETELQKFGTSIAGQAAYGAIWGANLLGSLILLPIWHFLGFNTPKITPIVAMNYDSLNLGVIVKL